MGIINCLRPKNCCLTAVWMVAQKITFTSNSNGIGKSAAMTNGIKRK